DRAQRCVDRAGELHQDAVAHDLDKAAAVLLQQWVKDAAPPRLEGGQGTALVLLHEPGISGHISRQNGSKAALDALFGHGVIAPKRPYARKCHSKNLRSRRSARQLTGVRCRLSVEKARKNGLTRLRSRAKALQFPPVAPMA